MRKMLLALTLVATTAVADDVIKRGAAIPPDGKVVPLETVLENPSDYVKTPVVVEGVIEKGCTRKGCWIQLAPESGKQAMRVTFKDYGFFVPLDSKGLDARAEGVTSIKVLPKKEVDHLESEGAKFTRNADGSANEVSFVASGIELRKK
jgi:hypothetical protein